MPMDGMSYSLGGTLGTLLYFIVKLLIIVLAVIVILGVIAWIRDNFFKNNNSKFVQDINNDPILKSVTIITLTIVGLIFLVSLLHSIISPSMNGNFGMGAFSPSFAIQALLLILIKVLSFVLIISLLLAAAMYLKNLYESGKLNNIFSSNSNQNNTKNDYNDRDI